MIHLRIVAPVDRAEMALELLKAGLPVERSRRSMRVSAGDRGGPAGT
jgi:hypothetical protein